MQGTHVVLVNHKHGPVTSLLQNKTTVVFLFFPIIYYSFLVEMPQGSSIFSLDVHRDSLSIRAPYIKRGGEKKNQYASFPPPWLDERRSSITARWHGGACQRANQDAGTNSHQSQVTVRFICGEPYFPCITKDLAGQCLLSLPPDKPQLPRRIYTACHIQAIS